MSRNYNKELKLIAYDLAEISSLPAEPYELFNAWMNEADKNEKEANAMSLATVDANGMPNVRIVLLKGASKDGYIFYTNFESQKGHEILISYKAALCFFWKTLSRQIRIRGIIEEVSSAAADIYFQSRPRDSRIGAWASQQSRTLESQQVLEEKIIEYKNHFFNKDVPRPHYWSGFQLKPITIEFWHEKPYRLHDRVIFERKDMNEQIWEKRRLYP